MPQIFAGRCICPDGRLLESCLILPRSAHKHTYQKKHTTFWRLHSTHIETNRHVWKEIQNMHTVSPIQNTHTNRITSQRLSPVVYLFHACIQLTGTHAVINISEEQQGGSASAWPVCTCVLHSECLTEKREKEGKGRRQNPPVRLLFLCVQKSYLKTEVRAKEFNMTHI